MTTHECQVALSLINRGFAPVPVPVGSKAPIIKNWPDLRITADKVGDYFNGSKPLNVGAIWGPASGGRSDVDLDCAEAVTLAPYFLPKTDSIYGRPGKRRSHYLYFCSDPDPKATVRMSDENKKCMVELRLGGGDKGAQSIMPGSIHTSGERYEWDVDGTPATASCAALKTAITKLAVAALLMRNWARGEHGHHELALGVGGVLARAGWSPEDAGHLVGAICRETGGHVQDNARTARESAENFERGGQARGMPWLIDTFDKPVAKQLGKLLAKLGGADDAAFDGQELATDLGNARRLVRLHGEDIRYVHAWRSWLVWEDGRWQRDKDAAVERMAKATVEDMFNEASRINDETKRTELRKHALKCQAGWRLKAMVQLAQSEIEVVLAADKIDADPYILGVQNGVVDLRSGVCAFREATQEDYVIRRAGVAFEEGADCPNWKELLNKIFPRADGTPDEELIKYFQRAIGYVLTGLTGEEVLFIMWGSGANGKSTVRETLFDMMGDYAAVADANLLITNNKHGGATPDVARLHGRRLITINETEQNDKLSESRMKFITGRDKITARNLFEDYFDFSPTHHTFLTTNHKPIVRSTDLGTWRRIHLLPFTFVIPEAERDDRYREDKLMPELSGILNWAIEGLKDYHAQGLKPPTSVVAATQEYRDDMDIIGRWIEERCKLSAESWTNRTQLYNDYEPWSKQEAGFAKSRVTFYRELADRGFQQSKSNGVRGFQGLFVTTMPM